MMSKQGDTLQGVALTQAGALKTTGDFKDATTFHCHADGSLKVLWIDDSTETLAFVAGDAFPIKAKAIEITTGTFSIGYD